MSKPLFSNEEIKKHRADEAELEKQRQAGTLPWDSYWSEGKALQLAVQTEMSRRVQERAEEFLNALIIVVGSHGTMHVPFEHIFSSSDHELVTTAFTKYDTPEARRAVYTILRALTEVPKTWARSAFVRFLRGIGKQKGSQYHGAGTLGADYGWKGMEVEAIASLLVDKNSRYSQALMSYADVAEEMQEQDPDYEEVDSVTAEYIATRVERDVQFLNQLCTMLETRGLASVPKAKEHGPKKERKVRQFKSGDIIRKGSIRDLPLPAHVRIPIHRRQEPTDDWVPSAVDVVVTEIFNQGSYRAYLIGRDPERAHLIDCGWELESKRFLVGATFVAPWTGRLVDKPKLKIKFAYRHPESTY